MPKVARHLQLPSRFLVHIPSTTNVSLPGSRRVELAPSVGTSLSPNPHTNGGLLALAHHQCSLMLVIKLRPEVVRIVPLLEREVAAMDVLPAA